MAPLGTLSKWTQRNWTVPLLLFVLTVFGAILRFRGLGEDSLWSDETATWLQSHESFIQTIVLTSQDTYPPAFNLLVLAAVKLFGTSEWSLRLPAAIVGTLAIPALYGLGAQFGRRTGLLAATMLAFAPFAIFYSQEARAYSLLLLGTILFISSVLSWLSAPSLWRSLTMVGTGVLLLYTHPYGLFVWVSVAAAGFVLLLLGRETIRRAFGFAALQVVIFVLFLPWVFVVLRVMRRVAGGNAWLGRPSLAKGWQVLLDVAGGPLCLTVIATGWLLAIWVIVRGARQPLGARVGLGLVLAAAGLLGPICLGLLVSLFVGSIFSERYFICCLPPALLLASFGFSRIAAGVSRLRIAVAFIFVMFGPSAAGVPNTLRHGEDWRSAVRFLNATVQPGDCLVVDRDFILRTLRFYDLASPPCLVVGVKRLASAAIPGTARVYVLLSHSHSGMKTLAATLKRPPPPSRLHFGPEIEVGVLQPGE